jgi:hypothetical protein
MSKVHVKQLRHESNESPRDGIEETLPKWIGEVQVGKYEREPRIEQNLGT